MFKVHVRKIERRQYSVADLSALKCSNAVRMEKFPLS